MRRRLTLTVTWVAATLLATFVVSLGVRVVTSEVTTRRPAPLALVRAAATTTSTTTTPPSTTTTTVARRATTTTVRQPPATTTTVPAATVRTANGRGGSISVRFTATSVWLVVATPSPGYAVEVGDRGPRSVVVEFRRDGARTAMSARSGDDHIGVEEDDGGGGGHGGPGRR